MEHHTETHDTKETADRAHGISQVFGFFSPLSGGGIRARALLMPVVDVSYDFVIDVSLRLLKKIGVYNEENSFDYTSEISEHQHISSDIPHTTGMSHEEELPQTFKSLQSVLKEKKVIIEKKETLVHEVVPHNTIMYAAGIAVPIYAGPTIEFDTQIGSIPYGEMIMVLEPKGRFLKIVSNGVEGWVVKEDIADRASRIYPEFVVGQENSVDHPNTAHVRAILGDPFGIGHSEFALQAGEYILYKLWRKGIRITWPETRPRVPGLWHNILRGSPRMQMSVTPKVGSVMEYMLNGEIGHLAYVEAVFPDNTIAISEVNYPDSGIYNERELSREAWRELKPVFIQVQ